MSFWKDDERYDTRSSKIVIGFYQVTSSTLNTFSYVEWPVGLLTVVQYANIIQLNLLQIIPFTLLCRQRNDECLQEISCYYGFKHYRNTLSDVSLSASKTCANQQYVS